MRDLMIHDVNLFDSTDGSVSPRRSVLVRQGLIDWVGPVSAEPEVEGVLVLDGRRRTVLPGLLNGHVHLVADADGVDPFPEDLEWGVARAIVAARDTLRTGVTTVRDCGSLNGLAIKVAEMVSSGLVEGTRIHAAGQVITMTGGHCHFMGRQVDGPWAVAAAVRAEIHAGADFIKIMSTGGVLTKGSSPEHIAFEQSELEQAARIAHNAGKRITSHAIGVAGAKNAVRAGIDSVEHAIHVDDELIELALANGTYIVPTLNAVDRNARNADGVASWMHEKVRHLLEASESGFRRLVDAGVRIAAGSDAGTCFNPHDEFPRELELMVRFGMSPAQALVAATRSAAENFGVWESLGSLEVGKIADLLLVDGDPTSQIRAVRDVVAVVKDGVVAVDALGGGATSPGLTTSQELPANH